MLDVVVEDVHSVSLQCSVPDTVCVGFKSSLEREREREQTKTNKQTNKHINKHKQTKKPKNIDKARTKINKTKQEQKS